MAEAVADPHRRHFRLADAVLALAFWLSVAGFIVLLTRHEHAQAARWSKWQPKAQGLLGVEEAVLAHVGFLESFDRAIGIALVDWAGRKVDVDLETLPRVPHLRSAEPAQTASLAAALHVGAHLRLQCPVNGRDGIRAI